VTAAIDLTQPYQDYFALQAELILRVLKDPKFPKTQRGRINFLADSTAGLGRVSPRRSRDICAAERKRTKAATFIRSYEYLVECSCGYEGPSKNHACKNCGAKIQVGLYGAVLNAMLP
jgi:hypothetical protein